MNSGFRVGAFVFDRKLGSGGMAEVWLARNVHLGTPVAIKFLNREYAGRQEIEQRFLDEGRRQGGLDHPNIVKVYSFEYLGGRSFLVLQYVDGESLEHRLARVPMEKVQLLQIAVGVLSALEFAHSRQIVHRDVKPSNIFIDTNGRVYLGDFGIVLALGEKRQTRAGSIIGTPEYMSPEQIMRPLEMDHRTDIYSFGCVLYEMLARRSPFASAGATSDVDFAVRLAHIQAAPTPLRQLNPAISPECEAVVMRALAKDPKDRYQTCRELRDALVKALNPRPQHISDPGHAPQAPAYVPPAAWVQRAAEMQVPPPGSERRRSPWTAILIAGLCVALAAIGLLGYYGWQSQTAPNEAEKSKRTDQEVPKKAEQQETKADVVNRAGAWKMSLLPGDWTPIDHKSDKQLGDELLAAKDPRVNDFIPGIKGYHELSLPFYAGTWLYEAETVTSDGKYALLTFLRGPQGITFLDGLSQTIYDMNRRAPLLIDTKDRAQAYLRFFCAAIQSKEGTFVIAQKPAEMQWRDGTDEATKDSVAGLFSPFIAAPLDGGGWSATGTVAYGDGIFSAMFKVQSDGHVSMNEDVPVRGQLPLTRVHFVGPVRSEF